MMGMFLILWKSLAETFRTVLIVRLSYFMLELDVIYEV